MASLPPHAPFSPASHLLPAWLRVPHTLPISGIGYGVILGSEPRPGEEQGRGPLGRRKGDLCLTHADVPEGLAAAHAGCHQARRPHVRTGLRHTGGDCWWLSYRIATPKGSGKSAPPSTSRSQSLRKQVSAWCSPALYRQSRSLNT